MYINRHLYDVGLMSELVEDEQLDVNFLLSQSLITISTLPFHLVNDLWRWRAFREEDAENTWLSLTCNNLRAYQIIRIYMIKLI